MKNILKLAYQEVNVSKKFLCLFLTMFIITAFYPSDSEYYKAKEKNTSDYVYFVEDGLRYTNTVMQVILPILLADKIGIAQAVYVGLGTFVSVHTLKRLLNNVYIKDTRIGQRPRGGKYNMPSGHSAMATSAMSFIIIRYGWIHILYLLPVSIFTMIVRVLLKAHTISAVLAGAILGIIIGLLFTSKYVKEVKIPKILKFFIAK